MGTNSIKKICKTDDAQEVYEAWVDQLNLTGEGIDVLADEAAWEKAIEALGAEHKVPDEHIRMIIDGEKEALRALTLQVHAQCRVLERILQKRGAA